MRWTPACRWRMCFGRWWRLGGRVGSAELRDWASRELHGYVGKELPGYRRAAAVIRIDVLISVIVTVLHHPRHGRLIHPDLGRDLALRRALAPNLPFTCHTGPNRPRRVPSGKRKPAVPAGSGVGGAGLEPAATCV